MHHRPAWTVTYNITSPENSFWVGTGWEFFDTETEAQACYDRHNRSGNCATKRHYYEKTDYPHLGVVHRVREMLDKRAVELVVAVADSVNANGDVYPEETLKKMANGETLFWDEENKRLLSRCSVSSVDFKIIAKGK